MKYCFFGEYEKRIDIDGYVYDEKDPDIVFSFGGDGTMLGAIHKYIDKIDTVKFIGIKTGNLGYFYSFNISDFNKVLDYIKTNKLKENKYQLLEYNLDGKNGYSLNEITLLNPIHTQIIEVYINDKLFETFRGSGFLACPPTGSTAFAKSMGGSILSPDIKAFELLEIASLNNNVYQAITNPIVLSDNYSVTLKPVNKEHLYISCDGEEIKTTFVSSLDIKLSNKYVTILNSNEDFFSKVKKAFLK